jgi:hypothetical protein
MCYTPEISMGFAVAGIAAIAYCFTKKGLPTGITLILGFYVLMELLQTVQYSVTNDCENPVNKRLTEVAYGFVIVQPLLWNLFFWANSAASEKPLFVAGAGLATVWAAVNLLGRIMYTPANALGPKDSVFASDKVCTRRGQSHLYWTWTTANLKDMNANFLAHLLIWFVPALLSSTHLTSALLLLAGAGASLAYGWNYGEPEAMTAAWCYISIPLLYLVFGKELLKGK